MKNALQAAVGMAGLLATAAVAQQPAETQCSAAATQATGYTPGTQTATGPDGSRVAGAAKGAAVGAVVGGAQGNQYENAPDALQDEHRENQAKSGAAAGMAVAGSRNRQDRRQGRRESASSEQAWQDSYNSCLQQQPSAPK